MYTSRFRQILLIIGDLGAFYVSLVIALTLRYQQIPSLEFQQQNLNSFSLVFLIWLIIFYINDLYNIRSLKNNFEFYKKWGVVTLINFVLAIGVFYFLPFTPGFTPKTNLLILSFVFGVIGFIWRRFYNRILRTGGSEYKVLIVGDSPVAQEIISHINHNPQLGYQLKQSMDDDVNLIVVPAHIKKDSVAAKKIYKNLIKGIEVMDLAMFYSSVFLKVPLAELEEVWFLENLIKKHKIYDQMKRPLEILLAIILFVILIIPALIISLLIKMTSRGPLVFKQIRIGRNEKEFTIYKFRSMREDAEKNGPQWSLEDDSRITALGKFLRLTHLDELPQLINIIRGDLSFVGPRPERPEFIEQLKKDIPYYDLRHLVRPGLTGWAQLNYRYGASSEDAYQKLQYDIYYLKNYSFWLDLSIMIKTIRLIYEKNI